MATQGIRQRITATFPMRQVQFGLGLAVSAVAIYIAQRGVEWPVAWQALQDAQYAWLVPAVAAMLGALLLRAVRWRLLFYPQVGLGLRHFYGVLNVGYMVNNLFPFQIGDLVRAYLLGQLEGLRKSRTFPTVLVERVVDVLILFALLMVLVPFVSIPLWASLPAAVAAGIVLVIAVAMVGMVGNRSWAFRLLNSLLRFVPGRFHDSLRGMTDSALDGLSVLSMPRIFARVMAWSLASWLTTSLVLYFVMLAFGVGTPFSAAIFIVVMTSFGFFVPSSPGALGVYHAISIESLVQVFGVERGLAASYSMVAHLIFYLPPIIIGVIFLWREHFSWRQLRALATEQPEAQNEVSVVAPAHDEAESRA